MYKNAYLCYNCYFSALYCNHYILAENVLLNVHSPGRAFGLPPSGCQLKSLEMSPRKLF